ncbi:MAG: hypothetical protein EXS47_00180 [Candidatus Zambryskibacteria bacterium]|nr:hypothetical protein [Candidatus Zambryskibacteria bacterium]
MINPLEIICKYYTYTPIKINDNGKARVGDFLTETVHLSHFGYKTFKVLRDYPIIPHPIKTADFKGLGRGMQNIQIQGYRAFVFIFWLGLSYAEPTGKIYCATRI